MTSAASEHLPAPAAAGAERRSRLRRYQAQLLERMHAAKSGAAVAGRQLGAQFGAEHCLLDLTQVSEIVPYQPPSVVPLAQDWYLGLCNIRGNLTGVIDLARYLGQPATVPGPDSRVVTFAPNLGFNCALLAARVLGLRKLDEMQAQADDGAPPADGAWCAQHYLDQEGQRWTRLDLAQLVREARFLQVGL
ncbi:MAG: chemotaxis protein CheW [Pseudomonadota bacterium]